MHHYLRLHPKLRVLGSAVMNQTGGAEKNQKEADSQPKVGSEYKKESEPTNKDKLLGCAVIGVIILVALALIGTCGDSSISDCWGSMGESIFKNAIKTRLNDPDSLQFHDTRTQEVEGQPRTAILVEYSAKNLFGGRVRKTAVGYLEETEGSACISVIVSMG